MTTHKTAGNLGDKLTLFSMRRAEDEVKSLLILSSFQNYTLIFSLNSKEKSRIFRESKLTRIPVPGLTTQKKLRTTAMRLVVRLLLWRKFRYGAMRPWSKVVRRQPVTEGNYL
jgi:hypothetical protein